VAQIEPRLGEKERNLEACLARLEEAAARGAEVLILPECATPGYIFDSAEEALPFAEEIPGPSTDALEQACRRLGALVDESVEAIAPQASLH
jgi:predicted amidohydrolase